MDYVEYIQQEYEWSDLPWKNFEINLAKLQKRIYQASRRDDVIKVRQLQKLLIKSRSAKLIAVRRISQDNKGFKTAGVDGVKSLTPKQRFSLVDKINLRTKVSPVRRVWIPKPGKEEKRPLGIPTMYDRATQCLVKMALEPEWEAKFEPNSYGFRPGRSCHDAIQAIFNSITRKAKYVLDADISQCFDKINHEKLIKKLNTFSTLRRQIRAWLKAGVVDSKELFPTSEGCPQGGVISPLLANIALHGMENYIKNVVESLDFKSLKGKYLSKRDKRNSVHLIRYADDFAILHDNYSVIKICQESISKWLKDMGLELKDSKTRTTHTLHNVGKEKAGFDFLGHNIRQMKTSKNNSGKNKYGESLGHKTVIKPSKKSIKKHYKQVADVIDSLKGQKQEAIINKLNPVIRGWCNYFSTVISKKVFSKLDWIIGYKLWKWAKKRHLKKDKGWIQTKYYQSEIILNPGTDLIKCRNWIFATKNDGEIHQKLLSHAETKIIRHIKVKGEASPYDGNLVYWSSRMGNHPEMPTRKANLLKKQKGKCNLCNLTFKEVDVLEVDHIIPKSKGGKDYYNNLQLLHKHCHDKKTKTDGSILTKSV